MTSIEELGFELERRSILFHRDTTMPDNSQLGYVGDPNACINGATPGQTLLFNSPPGTRFLDKSKTPMERWIKVVTGPGALWVIENAPPEGTSSGVFVEATAGETLGGNRIVIVYNGSAMYADKDTNYTGLFGMTLGAANIATTARIRINSIIEEPTWSLSQGFVFLGNNGLFTQTKPTTGMVILVGTAVSPTKIELNFQQLYKRY